MSIPGAVGVRDITFNGVDLTTLSPYLNFSYRDIHDLPERTIMDYKRSKTDGAAFVNAEYGATTKALMGWISAPSHEIKEQLRDLLLAKLQAKNGQLKLPESGAQRLYNCTLKDYVPTNKKGGGYEVFTLLFNMSDPFGYDLAAIITGLGTITFSFTDKPYTFGGTYDSVPAITLTVNSFTGTGSRALTVTNPATGIYMTVTRSTWANGDVVVFDAANRQVLVNGVATAWTGGLLSWAVGPGNVRISDTFTARNIAAQLSNLQRYV